MTLAEDRGAGRARFASNETKPRRRAVMRPDEPAGGVPLALELQAEPRLRTFAAWFAPALTPYEDPYRRRTYVELEREEGERRWQQNKRPINLWRVLAAHIAAGASGEAQPYCDADRALMTAIGLAAHDGEIARLINIDLDGTEYEPAGVVAALAAVVGPRRFLITSGSGKPGRYRVLLPIEPMPVHEMNAHAAALFVALGFRAVKGGVEIYPTPRNGRLPFGFGGCQRFTLNLTESARAHPYELLDQLTALPPVDLAAVARGPSPSAQVRPRPQLTPAVAGEPAAPMSAEDHASAARAVLAAFVGPVLPSAPPPPSPRPWSDLDPALAPPQPAELVSAPPPDPRLRAESSTRYPHLWRHGVPGPGHRDDALYKLARDSYYRHRPEARAVVQIQRWIRDGGIARSDAARRGDIEAEIADVPRRVGLVYATHPRGRPAAVHLSAREILAVRDLAERRAAVTGISARRIGELLHHALPLFKACARAGLPATRAHYLEWETWGGSEYAEVRTAAGIFEAVTGYLSQCWLRRAGRNPADAYARSWVVLGFVFDTAPPPRRRLGGSYSAATLAAQLVERRVARRTAAAARAAAAAQGAPSPLAAQTRSTIGTRSGSLEPTRRTQRSPGSAAHARDPDPDLDLPSAPPAAPEPTGQHEQIASSPALRSAPSAVPGPTCRREQLRLPLPPRWLSPRRLRKPAKPRGHDPDP